MRAPGRESAWALASALSEELAELARGDQMAPSSWPLKDRSARRRPVPPSRCGGGPRFVARIDRAVAAPHTDRCERGDQRPLHDRRHERELGLVAVLLRHHGDLQRVREAAPAELAIASETEELLETFLRPQGRPELDEHLQLVLAVVPEPVDRASRHHDALPG